jgi:hypothetical protein
MGDIYVAEPPHICLTPISNPERHWFLNLAARPPGSIWECDDCKQRYEARNTVFGVQWFKLQAARQVTG